MPRIVRQLIGCAQLAGLLVALLFASAEATVGAARECDSIWLVSSRHVPCGDPRLHCESLQYQVRDEQGCWRRSDLATLLATNDPSTRTIFWIHGNRYAQSDAITEGLATYRSFVSCASCTTPIRFIIFSWPSERIEGSQIDDVRVKAARTNPNGYYLAWLIDQMPADTKISLIGYSYGARIATGALHLLGDGVLNGWVLSERAHPGPRKITAVLIAAAMDNHWLAPGSKHEMAMSQIDRLTVIYNSCDRVLKRYRYLYCHGSDAEALGYTGFAGLGRLGPDRAKVTQIDACCYVGKYHPWEGYLASGPLMARICTDAILGATRQPVPLAGRVAQRQESFLREVGIASVANIALNGADAACKPVP